MIVAATLSLDSFLNSVSPTSPLSAISIQRYAAADSVQPTLFTTNCSLLLPCYKDTPIFSTRYGLFFFGFFSANPLLSILSTLFSAKVGGQGIIILPNYAASIAAA